MIDRANAFMYAGQSRTPGVSSYVQLTSLHTHRSESSIHTPQVMNSLPAVNFTLKFESIPSRSG